MNLFFEAFDIFNTDNSDTIDRHDFHVAVNAMGLDVSKKEILDILQNEALFDKFIQFALNSNSPLSSDTVDLMSTILNSMTRFSVHSYLSLIDMIIHFCSEILESKN